MLKDAYDLPISTSSAEAAGAFDRAVDGYLKARLDTSEHLAVTLKMDPEFGLAHCAQIGNHTAATVRLSTEVTVDYEIGGGKRPKEI